MTNTPPIPSFSTYQERNKWIKDHANYFTVIRRIKRKYLREERATINDAIALALKLVQKDAQARCMIYAVAGQHDALVASVNSDGVKHHE